VTGSFDSVAYNRAAWDREVENGNEWTRPVGPEVIARARAGDWSVVLIGYQPVPLVRVKQPPPERYQCIEIRD
jgi:ribosomal protein L32E